LKAEYRTVAIYEVELDGHWRSRDSLHCGFGVHTAVKKSMLVFWVVTTCGLLGRYQLFGERLKDNAMGLFSPKR
jgi:hypothetical protein